MLTAATQKTVAALRTVEKKMAALKAVNDALFALREASATLTGLGVGPDDDYSNLDAAEEIRCALWCLEQAASHINLKAGA